MQRLTNTDEVDFEFESENLRHQWSDAKTIRTPFLTQTHFSLFDAEGREL